jgi:hypothetical protein
MAEFVVDRWGRSPAVAFIELFNEVEMADALGLAPHSHQCQVAAATRIKRLNAFQSRPVCHSFAITKGESALDSNAAFDLTTSHMYQRGNSDRGEIAGSTSSYTAAKVPSVVSCPWTSPHTSTRVAVVTFFPRRLHRSTNQLWSPNSAATTCLSSAERLLVCTLGKCGRPRHAAAARQFTHEGRHWYEAGMDDVYTNELAAFAAFQNHLKAELAIDAASHHWAPLSIAKQQGVNAVGICSSTAAMLYLSAERSCVTKRFHRTQPSRWHSSSLMQRGQPNGFQLPVVCPWAPRSTSTPETGEALQEFKRPRCNPTLSSCSKRSFKVKAETPIGTWLI